MQDKKAIFLQTQRELRQQLNSVDAPEKLPPLSTFGERMKFARKQKKITQAGLSVNSGISEVHLSQLETGTREAKISNVTVIAKYLGVSKVWLAFGDDG
jgi:ribosome-binding protein aMBF1 (putative translation factor)